MKVTFVPCPADSIQNFCEQHGVGICVTEFEIGKYRAEFENLAAFIQERPPYMRWSQFASGYGGTAEAAVADLASHVKGQCVFLETEEAKADLEQKRKPSSAFAAPHLFSEPGWKLSGAQS